MAKHKYLNGPEDFLSIWDEYKKSVDESPDQIQKATNKGIQTERVKKPYTRAGFEAFAYRNRGHHIYQYIDNVEDRYKEYLGVVTCARREWEDDQLCGS